MKLEGEYAADPRQRAHRTASAIVFGILVGMAWLAQGGAMAIRTAAFHFMPLACIWFPEALARWADWKWEGGKARFPNPPALRLGGWFLLLVVPLLRMTVFNIRK